MAESQRGRERDIDIESRRELNAVADNSAVSERIVALKKSKAGHLGELTKIYRRLDEYLADHKFAIAVREDSHRLDNQWKRYSHMYYDLIQLLHESERMYEENRYAEHNRNYHLCLKLIDRYIASKEGIANVSEKGDNMADDDMMQLTKVFSANVPLSEYEDDVRSICSVRSKGSNVSRSSAAAHEKARLQKVLSEKRVEQLKRDKARRLKEQQLKLENQIAEAEDAVELAKTKVQFYEELEDPLGDSVSRANSVQDLNCEERLKNIKPKRIIKESVERNRKLEIAEYKPKIKDEKTELQASFAEKSLPGTVPLFRSTPGGAAISEPCVKECSMNPEAPPFIHRTLPRDRVCQPGSVSFATPGTKTMMARLTTSIDSIVTKSSLPPLDVVKFSCNPCKYFRFKSRFEGMVDTQNISEPQKMSRLLQFLDSPARSAVAGFKGVPGGLGKALKMLQQRFGQPHIVAKACVDALVDGPNISNNDGQGLNLLTAQGHCTRH